MKYNKRTERMGKRAQRSVLMLAGGTGGHIIPGLAIANELIKRGYYVHWLGTKAGLEVQLVPKMGIAIDYIQVTGLRGKRLTTLLLAPYYLLRALIQTFKVFRKIKPTLVVGMGGFVSGPGGLVAWLLRIPLVLHEQNAIAGTTNRILTKFSKLTLASFPNSFPKHTQVVLTGNPVRRELLQLPPPDTRLQRAESEPFKILVLGGSRGARCFNEEIPIFLKEWQYKSEIEVWHQTGQQARVQTQQLYAEANVHAKTEAFIEDMATAYGWADVVICRAGALTVSEIAAVGVASILIPLPHAIDDHQTLNAKYLSEAGAAILLPQKELTSSNLLDALEQLLEVPTLVKKMARNAYKLANRNALDKILEQMVLVSN